MESWILLSTRQSRRKLSRHESVIWSSSAVRLSSKTTIWSTRAGSPLNVSKAITWRFWVGLVKILTSTLLRCCSRTLRRQFVMKSFIMWLNWSNSKYSQNSSTVTWTTSYQKHLVLKEFREGTNTFSWHCGIYLGHPKASCGKSACSLYCIIII